jgi:aminoglycoside 6'-N-acetyltransferase
VASASDDRFRFRPVTEKDLPLLAAWLARPHVARWWDDPDELQHIVGHIDSISVEPFIIELNGRPIGYIQSYDPHLEDDHPYQNQPTGTLGIDQFIGEPELVGLGHGSRLIAEFVEQLFEEGVPRVIIDPDPDNSVAIRCYEKAGFKRLGESETPEGRALMMARDSEEGEA